jgi:hypothetical protein
VRIATFNLSPESDRAELHVAMARADLDALVVHGVRYDEISWDHDCVARVNLRQQTSTWVLARRPIVEDLSGGAAGSGIVVRFEGFRLEVDPQGSGVVVALGACQA